MNHLPQRNMEPLAHLPPVIHTDNFHHIPAHLQPAAYSDTHPQLATLVSSLLHSLSASLAPTPDSSRLSSPHSQLRNQHYALSLLLHHTQQALTTHPHRFPRLASTLQSADLAYCLHSQNVVGGIAGVTAEDVWSGGEVSGLEEYEVREERRQLVQIVEQRMAAQLDVMRAAYEDEEVDMDGRHSTQPQEDGDKENVPSNNDPSTASASRYTASASFPKAASLLNCRPVSAAFIALTSSPSSAASPSAWMDAPADPLTSRLHHRHQLLQRQHVALQLHLLSLHAQLLSNHRLSTVRNNDTALLACLKAKARCLELKLQLMTAHADLLQPAADSSSGAGQSESSEGVWTEVLDRLEIRRAEVASQVEQVERTKSGYEAVVSSAYGAEWHEVSARWRDVQRRKREKQWALKQLGG